MGNLICGFSSFLSLRHPCAGKNAYATFPFLHRLQEGVAGIPACYSSHLNLKQVICAHLRYLRFTLFIFKDLSNSLASLWDSTTLIPPKQHINHYWLAR